MLNNIQDDICNAIIRKSDIKIYYKNDDISGEVRYVEPYQLGYSQQNNLILNGFQTSGQSESNEPRGWKNFFLSDIICFENTGNIFVPETDYLDNPNRIVDNPNHQIKTLICQIEDGS